MSDLEKLFSPEHGLYGDVDRKVASFVDPNTGLIVHSLYGQTRRPTPEMLEGSMLSSSTFRISGHGFTPTSPRMGYAMEEAAKAGIRFIVLDRPNPINGVEVEGPILESHRLSFTGYFPLPVRHGMTVGELAMLFNEQNQIGAKLEVVKLDGWQRSLWLDEMDLAWVNPSPNIRNLRQATLYTAVGLLESTNLSVGRGTDTPFEIFGAPWINASQLTRTLQKPQAFRSEVLSRPLHAHRRSLSRQTLPWSTRRADGSEPASFRRRGPGNGPCDRPPVSGPLSVGQTGGYDRL